MQIFLMFIAISPKQIPTRKPKKRFSLKALVNDFGKVKSFRNHAFQRTLFQSKQIGQEIKKIDC